jgi:hypothetical protein
MQNRECNTQNELFVGQVCNLPARGRFATCRRVAGCKLPHVKGELFLSRDEFPEEDIVSAHLGEVRFDVAHRS